MSRKAPQNWEKHSQQKKNVLDSNANPGQISPKGKPHHLRQHKLFANHYIKNHLVGSLHAFGTDAAEVADGLLNAVFNDTVV